MNRIGIITLYDCLNQVDNCTRKIVRELRSYLDYFLVVCNFKLDENDYSFLSEYSEYIYERENVGFDGGAIKDALAILLSNEMDCSLENYDELVIVNDTFFGFFSSLSPFFDWFSHSDNDFAGLTKNVGQYLWMEKTVPEHIQGYFIAIKHRMFNAACFADFWKDFNYPISSTENIFNFEYRFSTFFSANGFKFDGFYDLNSAGLSTVGDVDYLDHPYELIRYLKWPIFKYKAAWIDLLNDSSYKALCMIKESYPDDFKDIITHVRKSGKRMYINQDELMNFCEKKNAVYIYGKGTIGKRVFLFLKLMGYEFKCFIISGDVDDCDKGDVKNVNDIKLEKNEGIIVGMNRNNVLEVKKRLDATFGFDALFYPNQKRDGTND